MNKIRFFALIGYQQNTDIKLKMEARKQRNTQYTTIKTNKQRNNISYYETIKIIIKNFGLVIINDNTT